MLERSIFKYWSEPSLPSHKLPISALVPEIICNKLFSSLVAFETDSFEMDLRGVRGDLPSAFTLPFAAFAVPFLIEIITRRCANMARPNWLSFDEIPFAISPNRLIFQTPVYERASCRKPPCRHRRPADRPWPEPGRAAWRSACRRVPARVRL